MKFLYERTIGPYIGNAAAVRDFRSQLRGSKALWIWTAYLALLIVLCGIAYSGIVSQQSQSVAQLQRELSQFYLVVMVMLASVICLAAPALTASAITLERQRRSLDLVFSAPVTPRYLLVGKLIAGLRYMVMLLVLALPVTSVCVVMGGATWSDVIGAFLILLSNGLVLLAIGLLISALSPTTMAAIISTYVATIAYLGVGALFSAMLAATMAFGSGMGMMGMTNQTLWTVTMSPFSAALAAPTYTLVGSTEVPNWIFGMLFSLVLAKVLIAGAGSALSPYGSWETKSLRLQALTFTLLMAFLAAVPLTAAVRTTGASVAPHGGPSPDYLFGMILGVAATAIFFLIPHISCFSVDAERKFQPDGVFSIFRTLKGTPSGGLPFLLGLAGCATGGMVLGYYYQSRSFPGAEFWSLAMWAACYLTFWWGVGRFVSSFKLGLRGARMALVGVMIVILAVPIPIFFMIMMSAPYSSDWEHLWAFYMLYPLAPNGAGVAWLYGIGCLMIGLLLALLGQENLKRLRTR